MTTHDDLVVIDTLDFLAKIDGQIGAFRTQLKQAAGLATASFVECRLYGEDLYVCICLETDVDHDKTLTWWMDIKPVEEQWLVEANVLWNGREVVATMPTIMAPEFRVVQREVPRLLKQLLDAGGQALVRARAGVKVTEGDQPAR